ncbi:MAG: type II toxin-antitoxin system prevent-host-death family antitoxin, partial [Dokdonella sp.]
AMNAMLQAKVVDELPRTPASDLKKLGWRGVMNKVHANGKVVVSNHDAPQAVILTIAEYERMVDALQQASEGTQPALDALRDRFDRRLASLQSANAGDDLRALMARPATLKGKVKVAKKTR